MTDTTPDPLAAIEALVKEAAYSGRHINGYSFEILREQIAEALWCAIDDAGIEGRLTRPDCDFVVNAVLAPLGEVIVTEEWGVIYDGIDGVSPWVVAIKPPRGAPRLGESLVRRTVTRTERVGEWEEVQ